ncbi:uncharacterized protein LOC131027188 [Cryptomeria japonica]|uniref:uncharacterized protein LOC131027188 n=1 Tax=Cryptomeria japonica TaxID=3369 RepID=UPI0027DA9635|nr:uncharacterized protein LOC131027188 [Cryptomeria japonica]
MAAYMKACAMVKNAQAEQQNSVLFPPPAGPYSSYLLLEEDEHDDNGASESCCWGCCNCYLRELPFPQNKCLRIEYTTTTSNGTSSTTWTECDRVYCIPVLGKPISSHCYYVVRAEGKHKGLVETCSTEEDMRTFCCCRCVKDVHPRAFQPTNSYQQMKIISSKKYRFATKSIASDGFPHFLRRTNWSVVTKEMRGNHGRLAHVGGENTELRAQFPPFDFSLLEKRPPIVIVGEWYCPFIFINELGTRLEDVKIQLMECPFYKMDLEKFWEEMYSIQGMTGKDVHVDQTLKATGVKLSWPIIAKMRADQDRYGLDQEGRYVRVKKSFSGSGMKGKFACYVVVETYVLKRMDGNVVLSYSFRNPKLIQGKWEVWEV